MTVLSDKTLRAYLEQGSLRVDPLGPNAIQPCSIDLTLGKTLLAWPGSKLRNPRLDQSLEWEPVPRRDGNVQGWVLHPGVRYLAATQEYIELPANLAGQLDGRSTWARDGLTVHQTAGWLDAGFRGRPTVELSVVGSNLLIWPGAGCIQLVLLQLDGPAERPYGSDGLGSRYQGSTTPTPARLRAEMER